MSKTGSPTPWSIKGIGPEAREAAKAAAKREGMTLGAWLSERVIAQAEEGGAEPPSPHHEDAALQAAPDIILSALNDHLTGLSERLDGMVAEVSRVSEAVDQAGAREDASEQTTAEIAQSVARSVAASITELMDSRAQNDGSGALSPEASEALAEAITQRVSATVKADLSDKIDQSVDADAISHTVSASVARTLEPSVSEQFNRSIAPVTARLDRLDATAGDSAIEDTLAKISTRIDQALTRQEEIASAVGEAVTVLAQRLDAMEAAVLAELEDQALQSQNALAREVDLTPPARRWLHGGDDVWAETEDELDDAPLRLSREATRMFKPDPDAPDEIERLDVAAVRARLSGDMADQESDSTDLKDSLSSLKNMLPAQEDEDATQHAPLQQDRPAPAHLSSDDTPHAPADPVMAAKASPEQSPASQEAEINKTAAVTQPEAEDASPGSETTEQEPSIEDLVQDAVSQYSVLQRMSEEARRLTNASGENASETEEAASDEQGLLKKREREDVAERNRRLDRELEMELQRALALKPDPTIATTLDLGGEVDDHLEFNPRQSGSSASTDSAEATPPDHKAEPAVHPKRRLETRASTKADGPSDCGFVGGSDRQSGHSTGKAPSKVRRRTQ